MEVKKGYFFSIFRSYLSEALQFRYLGVQVKKKYTESLRSAVPLNPIYLLFEDDEIVFYFHGYLSYDGYKNERNHTNIPIARFSLFGRRRLEQTLTEELLNACDDVYNVGNDIYEFKDCSELSYSNCYYDKEDNKNECKVKENDINISKCSDKEKERVEDTISSNIIIPHRRLLLDFIFDIENFNIFEYSPAYERIYKLLHDNTAYMSILSKADYYYQRKRCEKLFKTGRDKNIELLRDYFMRSEELWTDQIRKKEFESLCLTKRKWFEEDVEYEYKDVLDYPERIDIISRDSLRKKLNIAYCYYFYRTYILLKESNCFWKYGILIICKLLIRFKGLCGIKEKIAKKMHKLAECVEADKRQKRINKRWKKVNRLISRLNTFNTREKDFLKKASDFYLSRYAILKGHQTILKYVGMIGEFFHKLMIWVFGIVLFVLFIFFIIGIHQKFLFDKDWVYNVVTIAFIVPPALYFIVIVIGGFYGLACKLASVLILRLQMSLVIVWSGMAFASDTWVDVFEDKFLRIPLPQLLIILFILIFAVWMFVANQIITIAPSKKCIFKRSGGVVLFSFFSSAIIGILLMSTVYEFRWNYDEYKKEYKQHKTTFNSNTPSGKLYPVSMNSSTITTDTSCDSKAKTKKDSCDCKNDSCKNDNDWKNSDDTFVYYKDTSIYVNGKSVHYKDTCVKNSHYMWQHFESGWIGFHLFPRYFLFGAIVAVYVGLFIELGIKQRVVATESALPD